jgi:LysM repeat protein
MKFAKFVFTVLMMLVCSGNPIPVSAQDETPYDVIAEVNALRASLGLEPYVIDPWIMDYAQDHADYIAETQHSSHTQRDSSGPDDAGLHENVAGGDVGYVTPYIAVNEIWVDWGHRHIMVDYETGSVGAGVALSANGQIHYVLNVREGDGKYTWSTPVGGLTPQGEFTPPPFNPFITSTPSADGVIIHIVQEGQSLWSIAISYGVTVDEIRALNGIAADSTYLYIGQKLVIRKNVTMTPEVTPTASPTFKPTATATTIATSTPLPSRTPTPTPAGGLGTAGELPIIAVMIVVVLAGLSGILFVQFKVTKRPD